MHDFKSTEHKRRDTRAFGKNTSRISVFLFPPCDGNLPYKVVAVLPARSPLSVNRGRHQQPCSFFFLVSLDRPRGTLQLRHTQRRRLIHETLQNGYEALPLKFFFPSVLTATDASYIFHDHTPKIIIKHSLRRYSHASNTVLSVFKLDREKSRGNAFDEYNNRKHRHLRLIYPR